MKKERRVFEKIIFCLLVLIFLILVSWLIFIAVTDNWRDLDGGTLSVTSKEKEQILRSLSVSGRKVIIRTPFNLEPGKEVLENIGIVNTGLTEKTFGIKIEFIKKQNPDGTEDQSLEAGNEIIFFYNNLVEKRLSPTVGDVIPVTLSAKSSAAGNYLYKVDVLAESTPGACATQTVGAGCELYDARSFFVRVG